MATSPFGSIVPTTVEPFAGYVLRARASAIAESDPLLLL
jgi:hypothetical protein